MNWLNWYFKTLNFGDTLLFAFKFLVLIGLIGVAFAFVIVLANVAVGTWQIAYDHKIKPTLKRWTERKPETDTARKAA